MSLWRVKVIYSIAVVSIALILICAADLIGLVTAVLILVGAVPMFRAAGKAMKSATLHDVEQQAMLMVDSTEPVQRPKPHQDRHSQST